MKLNGWFEFTVLSLVLFSHFSDSLLKARKNYFDLGEISTQDLWLSIDSRVGSAGI